MAALPTGAISFANVNTHMSRTATAALSINDSDLRKVAEIPSGSISMNNLRGKDRIKLYQVRGSVWDSINLFTTAAIDNNESTGSEITVDAARGSIGFFTAIDNYGTSAKAFEGLVVGIQLERVFNLTRSNTGIAVNSPFSGATAGMRRFGGSIITKTNFGGITVEYGTTPLRLTHGGPTDTWGYTVTERTDPNYFSYGNATSWFAVSGTGTWTINMREVYMDLWYDVLYGV
jgi:hypothetical protein